MTSDPEKSTKLTDPSENGSRTLVSRILKIMRLNTYKYFKINKSINISIFYDVSRKRQVCRQIRIFPGLASLATKYCSMSNTYNTEDQLGFP
jgi:hypothetical protein